MELKKIIIVLLITVIFLFFLLVPIPCGREGMVLCGIGGNCPKEGDIKWCPSVYDSIKSALGITTRVPATRLDSVHY